MLSPIRDRVRLLLVAAVVAVALVPFWLGAEPNPVEVTPPGSFLPWPPFVLVWQVTDHSPEPGTLSPLSAQFGSRPCAVLEAAECLVQLAWDGFSRWSLTASSDPGFDAVDPRQATIGPAHYVIEDRAVVGVWSTDRVPPLHVCHRLLRAHWSGEDVAAHEAADQPAQFAAQSVVALEQSGGATAHCLGPSGIPIRHGQGSQEWTPISLELRAPTVAEIGEDLVRGETSHAVPNALPDPEPRRWLYQVAACGAGYPSTEVDSGVNLQVPDVSGQRPVFAWVTGGGAPALPDGMRRRLLETGLVVDELLAPAPMISVPTGELRVWLGFQGSARWDNPEREIFVLEQVAQRLAHAAANDPYQGASPAACR